jgi:DNA (cytosine-5)-methyltransferase 1
MGNEDDRALWPEMFRVIIECRPRWVVAENVPGIVDMALDGVLSDLENQGYEVGTMVIPACAVNAPHRRDRVWIVAHHARQNDWEYHGEPGKRQIQQSGIRHGENVVANPKSVGSESPRTEKPESQGAERADGGRTFVANPDSPPKNRPAIARRQCRRGQLEPGLGGMAHGLPGRMDGHFDEEPNIPRIATGIPDRAARLRALGNSIVPQVAYQIISNISKLEKSP